MAKSKSIKQVFFIYDCMITFNRTYMALSTDTHSIELNGNLINFKDNKTNSEFAVPLYNIRTIVYE